MNAVKSGLSTKQEKTRTKTTHRAVRGRESEGDSRDVTEQSDER